MATENLREFLVSLGFRTDETALRKFQAGVDQAAKSVLTFAGAIEGTAVIIAAGVARWASNLESLYFASQRIGTSVSNIKAFDRAATDLGASAGEAQQSLEGIAHALRTNPQGIAGMLAPLGVQLKLTRDGASLTIESIKQLATAFQNMPIQRGEQYIPLLGMSERTFLAMRDPSFLSRLENAQKLMRGANWDTAADSAHKFENTLRDTWMLIENIGIKVGNNLARYLGFTGLEQFNDWLLNHSDEMAKRITDAIDSIIKAAEWVGAKFLWLVDKLKDLDTATGGWSTKILIVAALLKVSGAGSIIGGTLSFAAALTTLSAAGWGVVAALAAVGAAIIAIHELNKKAPATLAPVKALHSMLLPSGIIASAMQWAAQRNASPHPFVGPRGLRNNNPGNLKYAGQAGASDAGGYAVFGSADAGLLALGRQLELYASRGNNTVAGILSKFAPNGVDGNDTASYIADVSRRLGVGANATLNMHDPSLVARLISGIIYHENGSTGYSDAAISNAAKRAVTMNPQITINVNGAGDPQAVADRVDAAQRRMWADLARNAQASP